MRAIKQRTRAGNPGRKENNYGYGREYKPLFAMPQACVLCAFYELIIPAKGYPCGLCHFTGRRDPLPGLDGCRFIAGSWQNIEEILGLRRTPQQISWASLIV